MSRLDSVLNIEDLRRLAHRRVPAFALAYVEAGAEDHATLQRNRDIFRRWQFVPDALVEAAQPSLGIDIFGAPASLPCIVAPTGFNGMLYHRADALLAQAAARAGIPFTLSTMSNAAMEDVAQAAPGLRFWYQLYMFKDAAINRDLVRRAEAVGSEALVFTVDCQHFGNRESERRYFRGPMQLSLKSMLNAACHPAWAVNIVGGARGVPGFGNLAGYFSAQDRAGRGSRFIAEKLHMRLRWADLAWLRETWPRKLVVKGILTAADARRAIDLGADAIVLSNHGGRQLDGCISPMEALEEIRAACGDAAEIFIDSGFRRGTDIAKALALGANAVMLGRPLLYGAGAAGRPGIDKALDILASELGRTLAQLGVPGISGLEKRHLRIGGTSSPAGSAREVTNARRPPVSEK